MLKSGVKSKRPNGAARALHGLTAPHPGSARSTIVDEPIRFLLTLKSPKGDLFHLSLLFTSQACLRNLLKIKNPSAAQSLEIGDRLPIPDRLAKRSQFATDLKSFKTLP
jgi:hypothetical protein